MGKRGAGEMGTKWLVAKWEVQLLYCLPILRVDLLPHPSYHLSSALLPISVSLSQSLPLCLYLSFSVSLPTAFISDSNCSRW